MYSKDPLDWSSASHLVSHLHLLNIFYQFADGLFHYQADC